MGSPDKPYFKDERSSDSVTFQAPIPLKVPPLLVRIALWACGYGYATMTIHQSQTNIQQNIMVIGKGEDL